MLMKDEPAHLSEERLNQFLDGALPPQEAAGVELHLRSCSACRADLHEYKALFAALTDLPAVPLELDLAPRIVQNIQSRERFWLSGQWFAVLQVVISAAVLFLSWPLLVSQAGRLPQSSLQINLWISNLQENILVRWATSIQAANDMLTQMLAVFQWPVHLSLQEINLWSWIIALGFLWMAVNGLLLRPGSKRSIQSPENGSTTG